MTVEIALSQGFVALVDDADAPLVQQFAWHAAPRRRTTYARRDLVLPTGHHTRQYLHTFLTGFARTDHFDGDGLNNQRANLRQATREQNMHNMSKHLGCSSRFKGVSWHRARGLWRAVIGPGGRQIHLGHFADEAEAARAYDAAARQAYGPFAALNFPAPGERSALAVAP